LRYEKTVPFHGDGAKALEAAIAPLTSLGFRIVDKSATAVEFQGPGMNSTRESALLGATRIRVIARSHELALEAELGGVEFMSRFVRWFPLALSVGIFVVLSLVFAIAWGNRIGAIWIWPLAAAVGVNVAVWLLLSPLLSRRMVARSCLALDALLGNLAIAGR
jgi:hypothetical protein